jgi:hypothetical protein
MKLGTTTSPTDVTKLNVAGPNVNERHRLIAIPLPFKPRGQPETCAWLDRFVAVGQRAAAGPISVHAIVVFGLCGLRRSWPEGSERSQLRAVAVGPVSRTSWVLRECRMVGA